MHGITHLYFTHKLDTHLDTKNCICKLNTHNLRHTIWCTIRHTKMVGLLWNTIRHFREIATSKTHNTTKDRQSTHKVIIGHEWTTIVEVENK